MKVSSFLSQCKPQHELNRVRQLSADVVVETAAVIMALSALCVNYFKEGIAC